MHIDDKTAGHAYQALGDLADAFVAGIEAMTRIAVALQPNKPTAPNILLTNPITCATNLRALED